MSKQPLLFLLQEATELEKDCSRAETIKKQTNKQKNKQNSPLACRHPTPSSVYSNKHYEYVNLRL